MSRPEPLAKLPAQKRKAAVRRPNPELEARLEKFIAENPHWRDHYLKMGSQEVVRRMMLARMARTETAGRRAHELDCWAKENPDIIAKVADRVKATKSRLRSRAADSITQTQAPKSGRRRPSPGHPKPGTASGLDHDPRGQPE